MTAPIHNLARAKGRVVDAAHIAGTDPSFWHRTAAPRNNSKGPMP